MSKRSATQPRTQRAWAGYDEAGRLDNGCCIEGTEQQRGDIAVLVVPEAAVTGCKHGHKESIGHCWHCRDCGALAAKATRRWIKPRLLRHPAEPAVSKFN